MTHIPGITTVLFDLDGTLRYSLPAPDKALIDRAVALGLPDQLKARRRAQRWAHYYFANSNEYLADRAFFGDLDDQFWRNYVYKYLLAYGCPAAQRKDLAARLTHYMAEEYDPEDWIPPEVPDTLEELRAMGLTVAVVSNRTEPFGAYIEQVGLEPFLAFSLAAGEVDSWKPDPGIFKQALELAEAGPQQTVYVGDNYYADVLGARKVGIRPILVDPEGLFPQARCQVIRSLGGLLPALRGDITQTLPQPFTPISASR